MSDTTADLVRQARAAQRALATPESEYQRTMQVLLWVVLAMAAVLGAGLALQLVGEEGLSNSYALLADAFLNGRLDVTQCVDIDCALYDGKNYVVFPPGPAILAMPFVAVFGTSFAGFIALTTALSGLSLLVWWRILAALRVERMTMVWILIALAFGTPLYYVTIRGDGVWFLAQTCGFLFVSLAVWASVEKRSWWLIGAFAAAAFLSRQMTILMVPFYYALRLEAGDRLISFRYERLGAIAKMALPVVIALAAYMAYNYARFGGLLDTGYAYIGLESDRSDMIFQRVEAYGLFAPDYFLFNLFHLLFQGFHADFIGPTATELGGMDRMGTSLLAASPFVLLAVFTRWNRPLVIGALCAAAMIAPMLLYHSNGFTQYNVQRYVLDWLPVVLIALATTIGGGLRPAFAVLVTYAVGLTVATSAVAYLTQA